MRFKSETFRWVIINVILSADSQYDGFVYSNLSLEFQNELALNTKPLIHFRD